MSRIGVLVKRSACPIVPATGAKPGSMGKPTGGRAAEVAHLEIRHPAGPGEKVAVRVELIEFPPKDEARLLADVHRRFGHAAPANRCKQESASGSPPKSCKNRSPSSGERLREASSDWFMAQTVFPYREGAARLSCSE